MTVWHVFLSPLGLGLLAALYAMGVSQLTRRWRASGARPILLLRACRLTRILAMAMAAMCVVAMTPWAANALLASIERRVVAPATCQETPPQQTVLLSGGLARPPADAQDYGALTRSSQERVAVAARLLAAQPQARMLITGGGPFAVPEAAVMASLLQQLGIAQQRLTVEPLAFTTWDNAIEARRFRPALADRIWLVTSPLHMPRAMRTFERAGFTVCPAPTASQYLPPGGSIGYYLPQSSALEKTEQSVHELIGMVLYDRKTMPAWPGAAAPAPP